MPGGPRKKKKTGRVRRTRQKHTPTRRDTSLRLEMDNVRGWLLLPPPPPLLLPAHSGRSAVLSSQVRLASTVSSTSRKARVVDRHTEQNGRVEVYVYGLWRAAYLDQPRLEVGVDEDVVPVELEAVLVVDDGLLHRQQRSAQPQTSGRGQRPSSATTAAICASPHDGRRTNKTNLVRRDTCKRNKSIDSEEWSKGNKMSRASVSRNAFKAEQGDG